ncbi:hypothetical protein BCR32DRAFT_269858 [Anaeromyces robustus]|uniref:RGS domain-containing protein n=1 Tax=Anaeromyces robustus TaxID=1754192 RepID=A0A1Y1WZ06_9FUNG|nr:hypothetical protein BCR32DRAFT_269858 [Anaeromyces robustus]|eukprot:ORX78807.1 hypothetical protein BCR32DRAFT_269858 [Anaeromyces robustus]
MNQLSKYQYSPVDKNLSNPISNYTTKNEGLFINLDKPEGKIYAVLNVISIIYFLIPLVWICFYRNWYIIKQRNFILTFIGGIATFISTFFNLITQIAKVPCAYTYYAATVFSFIMQICFISRALRLIFLYRLNVYKVTELSQDKFIHKSKNGQIIEPNIYYKSIYKMADKRIAQTLIPVLIFIYGTVCVVFHYVTSKKGGYCGFSPVNINEKVASSRTANNNSNTSSNVNSNYGKMKTMFMIPIFTGTTFVIINILIAIKFTFSDIRDDQKFGIKFDCFSNTIVSIIARTIYLYITIKRNKIINQGTEKDHQKFLKFNDITKDGLVFFIIIGFYIHATSIIIPLYKCIKARRMNRRYINEPTNTIEYIYIVLNSPSLVEELKVIAIQEFEVENVIFWENYCTLHKLVAHARKKQEIGDSSSGSRISHDHPYSQSSSDAESYDPNYPLLPKLVPYYNAFYHTFIDMDGPAAVNITGDCIRRINHDFTTYPVVGIFDEAKDEVVESMYFSIFPLLLQNNRKQLNEVYFNS